MSSTKKYLMDRARDLNLDEELTDETIEKITEADAEYADHLYDSLRED